MKIHCFECGKPVTAEIPNSIIFRATATCPECEAKNSLSDAPEWKGKPDLSCSLWAFRKNKYLPPQIFRLSQTYMDKPPILECIGSQGIMYLDGLPPYYKTGKWYPVVIPTPPEEKQ